MTETIHLPPEVRQVLDNLDTSFPCYVLDEDNKPVRVSFADFVERGGNADNRIAHDTFGSVSVSTVFLPTGVPRGEEGPKLFETMVFGGPMDNQTYRCATHAQALEQHAFVCESVKAARASSWMGDE